MGKLKLGSLGLSPQNTGKEPGTEAMCRLRNILHLDQTTKSILEAQRAQCPLLVA